MPDFDLICGTCMGVAAGIDWLLYRQQQFQCTVQTCNFLHSSTKLLRNAHEMSTDLWSLSRRDDARGHCAAGWDASMMSEYVRAEAPLAGGGAWGGLTSADKAVDQNLPCVRA